MIPSTAELLLQADWRRPRSQQRELGMSDLGGCRRRAGYQMHGYPHEKPSGSVQAVIGTAVHDKADAELILLRDLGLIPPNSVINEEVRFGGLLGHPDLYVDGLLRDIKTIGYDIQLANYRLNGPPRQHIWQVMTYAAALILDGRPVDTVQLDYLVRDSGNSWTWSGPFDYEAVREAMTWLQQVREVPLDWLSRDYAPDSPQCKHCPFSGECWSGHVIDRDKRSVLLVEDPDAAKWAAKLKDARERKRAAEADEELAKGALDALRPNTRGRGEVQIEGFPWALRWTVSTRRSLDADQVREDYARGGATPPLNSGESVKLELVAPREEH
jgi:CRISPR/Cas system-associated exonuclease Cas4 (RecB family)